jgi:uncharacterized 2Fe-2S/4Fe-4S cluster protein (DUF4445 family)
MKRSGQKQNRFKVILLPFETSVEVPTGTNLLEAIKAANLPLKATCGGQGTCGDCVVQVVRGDCKRKSSAALAERLFAQGFSLACLTEITENLVIELPQFEELALEKVVDSKFFDEQKHRISGVFEVDPPLKKTDLLLPSPSLEASSSDLWRLERELQKRYPGLRLDCEYYALKKLPHAARKDQGNIWAILYKRGDAGTILDVGPQSTQKKVCGIACDVGTSTVALHLVELETGKILGTASSSNQQLKCGEDVISRIDYAQKPDHLEELHDLILRTINHLIEKVTRAAGILLSEIYYASVAGNTTMIHLFLNLDPRFIREEPYVSTFNQVPEVLAQEIGLSINPKGRISCSPSVGSYVGGDIAAGLLATPLLRDSDKISLFIDAGTNGEIVVGNKEWLMTCACSAGPAFEGGGIRCGMSASEGAIEKIEIKENGEIQYSILNGAKPKGLCGSALVDLLAELFIHGIIDRHGKFKQRSPRGPIVKDESGLAFRIEQAKNTHWGHDLLITESDIANLIRTKAAVFSACSTLLKKLGLRLEQIESFYIAGGFGKCLNVENAIRIGLLPDLERGKFYYLGNTSLLGAYLILLSDKNKEMAQSTAKKMTYIELNAEPKYMNEYTASLFLPHTDLRLFPSVENIFSSKNLK